MLGSLKQFWLIMRAPNIKVSHKNKWRREHFAERIGPNRYTKATVKGEVRHKRFCEKRSACLSLTRHRMSRWAPKRYMHMQIQKRSKILVAAPKRPENNVGQTRGINTFWQHSLRFPTRRVKHTYAHLNTSKWRMKAWPRCFEQRSLAV